MLRFLTIYKSNRKEFIKNLNCVLSNIDIDIDIHNVNLHLIEQKSGFDREKETPLINCRIDIFFVEIDVISLELLQNFYVKIVCRLVKVENITGETVVFRINDNFAGKIGQSSAKYLSYDVERGMISRIKLLAFCTGGKQHGRV